MTATGSRAPVRRMHPEDRREQILRESLRLIATSGFNAVSLSDVARACGIQKSSVLHHFPSMNDLLLAVLTLREQQDLLFYTALDIESPADGEVGGARRRRGSSSPGSSITTSSGRISSGCT